MSNQFLSRFLILPLFISTTLFSCRQNTEEIPEKPNVLFILADDFGVTDMSFLGSEYYETPNLDRIAKEGMVFTQGYAACRVCSPSRASIMTGKFTARHGITDWIGAKSGKQWREHNRHDQLLPAEYVHQLPKEDKTIAEAMKEAGYKTFFAGKWHLGDEGSSPEDHGFDINIGGWKAGSPAGGYYSPWDNPRLENKVNGENLSMRLANETAEFIEKNQANPFFAYLAFYAVHGPIQTTQAKWRKYRDKAVKNGIDSVGFKMERVLPIRVTQDNPVYAGLVESMDDAVGVVLDKLEKLGLDKKTIVIFTSDNGGVASGDSFSTSNLPLRGGKGYQWEGGIREPYFIKVPWLDLAGKSNATPVIGTDFYPTILDLANLKLIPEQHQDGVSLKPLLEGGTIPPRTFYWHYPHYGNQGGNPSSVIREDEWKLIHYYEDGRNELYNLGSDPDESQDIAEEFPEVVMSMSQKLKDFLKEVNARFPTKDETYDSTLAQQRHEKMINETLPRLERQRLEMLSDDYQPNANWWDSQVTKD